MRVSVQFLFLLEQRLEVWNDNPCLGDVFMEVVPEFDVYDKYLMDHHRAIVTITQQEKRSQFAQFLLAARERPECESLDIFALLITPVQRILRYKLLLEDLIKNTPDAHHDHKNLATALGAILTKAVAVNESIKAAENYEKLCQIQKSFITGNSKNLVEETRLFVREGSLTKVCRKIPKRRWFFLFSDILIYASIVTQSGGGNLYSFHRMFQLGKTKVKSIPDTETQKFAFQIITNDKSFTVFADTEVEKTHWLHDLNERTVGAAIAESDPSAPVWVPDSGGSTCTICRGAFTRHHCRQCGNLVCGSCSNGRMVLQHSTDNKPVRVCDQCAPPPPTPPPLTPQASTSSLSSQPVSISAPTFSHGSNDQAVGGSGATTSPPSPPDYLPQSIAARQSIIAQINLNRTTSKPGSIRPTNPLPPTPHTSASPTSSAPSTPSVTPTATCTPNAATLIVTIPTTPTSSASSTLVTPATPSTPATLTPTSTPITPTSPTPTSAKLAGKPIPPTPNGVPVLKRANTVAGTPSSGPVAVDTPPLPPKPVASRNTLAPGITVDAPHESDRPISPRSPEPQDPRESQVLRSTSVPSLAESNTLESEVQLLMANLSKMLKCEAAIANLSLINRVRYFSAKIHEHNVKYNAPPANPPPTPNPQAINGQKSVSTSNLLASPNNAHRVSDAPPVNKPIGIATAPNGTTTALNGAAVVTPAPATAPVTATPTTNGATNATPNGTHNAAPSSANGATNGNQAAPNGATNGVPNGAPKANTPAKPVSVLRTSNASDPPALPVLPPRKANQTTPRPLPPTNPNIATSTPTSNSTPTPVSASVPTATVPPANVPPAVLVDPSST